MKKTLLLLLVLVISTTGIFAQGSSEKATAETKPVNLTIYSPGNVNSVPTKSILKFKELVEAASAGSIVVTANHSGELGNDAEALQSTRMGTIDIIFAGTSGFTSFYDKAKILDLPFLFKDAQSAYEIVNSDIGEKIFADMPTVGLVYLSEGDNGMRHIATTKRPINSVDDVKGLKIRVPTSKMYLDVWSALGATPVALSLNELAIALANGTAEAQDNATYHLVANATYDDIEQYSFINYMWMGCTMAMNEKAWNSLSSDQQKIIKENATIAAKYSFDTIEQDNKSATEILKKAGVNFNETPDINSFKNKLGGAQYYKQYASEKWYDQAIVDAILAK